MVTEETISMDLTSWRKQDSFAFKCGRRSSSWSLRFEVLVKVKREDGENLMQGRVLDLVIQISMLVVIPHSNKIVS